MEPEVLDGRVDQEAWRVAVVFGVNVWHERYWIRVLRKYQSLRKYVGYAGNLYMACWITKDGWQSIQIGTTEGLQEGQLCGPISSINLGSDGRLSLRLQADSSLIYMARGLYRLGFEDEGVVSQLPALSAHERMELRLSLPREFWPKTWLGEETE